MKLSTKTRYGLRLMIDLAQHYHEGPISLSEVAKRQDISKKYLEQVVSPLVKANLLVVTRGYTGGYELSRTPAEITCADIAIVTEEGFKLLDCLKNKGDCKRSDWCLSRNIWAGLEKAMIDYLNRITLQDILDKDITV